MSIRQTRRNRRMNVPDNLLIKHGLREIVLISFCFMGLYLFVSLVTYTPLDPGWWRSGSVEEIKNKGGLAGAMFSDFFFFLFGYFAYLFPIIIGYVGLLIYRGNHIDMLAEPKNLIMPSVGFILTLSAGCGLAIVHFAAESTVLPSHAGGILGILVGKSLQGVFSQLGATLLLLALFFTGVTLLTGLSWLKLMDVLGYYTLQWLPVVERYLEKHTFPWITRHIKQLFELIGTVFNAVLNFIKSHIQAWKERRQWEYDDDDYDDDEREDYLEEYTEAKNSPEKSTEFPLKEKTPIASKPDISTVESPLEVSDFKPKIIEKEPVIDSVEEQFIEPEEEKKAFELPALSLLNPVLNKLPQVNTTHLSTWMQEGLKALQIESEIKSVHTGPRLINFEVQTITHINVNHLGELSEALAQVLNVEHLHTVETMPGILGIEVSSLDPQTVYLRELLSTPEYQDNDSPLTLVLGKDVTGNPVIVNLSRIPHIVMAGSNAAEKNMAINSLLLSVLYKSPPTTTRLLLIDNASEKLSIYEDLPHLLIPIVYDKAEVADVLEWCVHEMENRYKIMGKMGVHNIDEYNKNVQVSIHQTTESQATHQGFFDEDDLQPMYSIIIIIHEIKDLMVDTDERIEKAILNLAQKSRASGIYLILATQYPSIHVITGLLKANIPTRIAFQVENKGESRVILGQVGAEILLGEGDMLYMTVGMTTPVRVHGCFVTQHEVEKVITDLKNQATPDYIELN